MYSKKILYNIFIYLKDYKFLQLGLNNKNYIS
jgi:hypothetical protein